MDGLYFSVVNQINSCPSSVGNPYPYALTAITEGVADCAHYISDGIKHGLEVVANELYHCAVDMFHYPAWAIMYFLGDDKIDDIKYQFCEKLISVQSASMKSENSEAQDSFLSRDDLLVVLNKIPPSVNRDKLITRLQSRDGALDAKDWAEASLRLEAILIDCKRKIKAHNVPHTEFCELHPLEFVQKNIEHLEFKSRFAWAQQGHEAIVDELENELSVLWDQAYSEAKTVYGSVGVDVGVSKLATVGARVSVGQTEKTFIDDEYNVVLLETINLNTSVVAKVKDICGIVEVSAEGKKTTSVGDFKECSSAREFAMQFFEQLVAKRTHRRNPKIARYLTRRSTVGCTDFILDALTGDEILEVNTLKKKNALAEKTGYMKKQLSIFATAVTSEEEIPNKPLNYIPTIVPDKNVIHAAAQIDTWTATAKASVGIGDFGVSARLTAQHEHMLLELMRFTSYCDRLGHKLKSTEQKEELASSIQRQFLAVKDTIIDEWKKDLIKATFNEVTQQHELRLVEDDHFTVAACLQYIEQEFEYVTHLHARITTGDRAAQADLAYFLEKYQAKNTEQWLHNMVIFNAHLFSLAKYGSTHEVQSEASDVLASDEQESLQTKIVALEKSLLTAAFDVGQEKWKERLQIREQVDFDVFDKKVNFVVKAGYQGEVGVDLSVKVELLVRERFHTNPLRSGDYIDVSVSPLGLSLPTNARLLTEITKKLQAEVAHEFGDVFRHAVQAPGAAMNEEGVFVFRFFKPHALPELGYTHLFTRLMRSTESKWDFEVPLWIVPCVDLVMGAGYSSNTLRCVWEKYSDNTMLYFAVRYMHDWSFKNIRDTGEIDPSSYWKKVTQEQCDALRKMFARFKNQKDAESLMAELAAFNDSIGRNKVLSQTEKNNFELASTEFTNAMKDPHGNFDSCLQSFENLFHKYIPQFNEGKVNSSRIHEPAIFSGESWVAVMDNQRKL